MSRAALSLTALSTFAAIVATSLVVATAPANASTPGCTTWKSTGAYRTASSGGRESQMKRYCWDSHDKISTQYRWMAY
ncbi:MAG: hypothetical protein JWN72_2060 [Thermoleophilia bacterium]|nr:hypothetical protein [Thermoleophilia bacterium]